MPSRPDDDDALWRPTPESISSSRSGHFLSWLESTRGISLPDYPALWHWSVDDLPAFWRSIWDYFEVEASTPPAEVLATRDMPGARWFPGVRMNYAENALRGPEHELVLVARSQTRDEISMTRGELRGGVARAAAGLRRLGVQGGDRVVGYLPNTPEAVIAFLACASIGAVFAVCAPELGIGSALDRLRQLDPTVLIAVDGYRYGDKDVDRSEEVAALQAGLPSLTDTVRVPYLRPRVLADIAWADLLREVAEPAYEQVAFDAPLWVLFSSGTTGLPKAIVHSHGGIVLEHLKSHALHSDLGPGDRYFVFCTTSWVMWNILVGGLLVGATIILMDGNPGYPDTGELWRVCAETRTTVFGCGAAYLMASRRERQSPGTTFDLSALRGILSTGSPLPDEGFRWVYEAVGQSLRLQSGSGGTDVCTGFVGGSPMVPVIAGEIACRCLGVQVDALDPDGNPVVDELGELVVSAPMPSMPIFFWDDPDGANYRAAYFEQYPGRWRHGDWIRFTDRGSCVITGRSDGTLNRGGVRLGTSEFYSVLADFPEITDSLVVHLEDDTLGTLLLFVQMEPGFALDDALQVRITTALRRRLSPRHGPDEIVQVAGVPYNLTGKKLEVPVKRLLQGLERSAVVSDGAVRDPRALDDFVALAARYATTPRSISRATSR